jgi:two-component system nitrate/nitrite response regulator NarL
VPGTALQPRRITVVLIDCHALFRLGLRRLLEHHGIAVLAEAPSVETGMRLVVRHAPDVVVVDPGMPELRDLTVVETIRRMKASAPRTHVLALSRTTDGHDVVDVVRVGGSCYLLKDAPVETILAGVRAAAAGEALIAPKVATALVRRLRAGGGGEGPPASSLLSGREQEVLRLMTTGMDNDGIASELFISRHTVKNHISSILDKLEVTNRVQAAVRAVREALV